MIALASQAIRIRWNKEKADRAKAHFYANGCPLARRHFDGC
jgi:hypothetical protein